MKAVIYYNPRQQSPLMTDLYTELSKSIEHQIELVYDTFQGVPLQAVSMSRFNGEVPDLVLNGAGSRNGLLASHEYVREHGIKTIATVLSDTNWIHQPEQNDYRHYIFYDGIVAPWHKDSQAQERMNVFNPTVESLRGAKSFNIPWCINLNKYPDKKISRSRDIAHICSVDQTKPYHYLRLRLRAILNDIPSKYIGNAFGNDYVDILNQSHLAAVEDTNRGYLTQSYLENASCGAVNIGIAPEGYNDISENMIVINKDDMFTDFIPKFKEVMKNLNQLNKIRKHARDNIEENYNLYSGVEKYIEMFERV